MFPEWNRRSFVQTLFASAAHLSLAASGVAQTRPAAAQPPPGPKDPAHNVPLAVTTLTDTVALISGAGGNVVVVMGPDAVAMINGGVKERSNELLEMVATRSGGKRIQTLFNTDQDPETDGQARRGAVRRQQGPARDLDPRRQARLDECPGARRPHR